MRYTDIAGEFYLLKAQPSKYRNAANAQNLILEESLEMW